MTLLRSSLLAAVVLAYFAYAMLLPSPPLGLGSGDLYDYHYFVSEYVFAAFRRGELPAWNPFQLEGLPTIAALEVGAFYPPNLLHLVLPTYAAMAAVTLFHLLLVAFTTWTFARRAGIGASAALAAAVVFTLRGTFPNFAISPNLFAAAAWLPLGAIAVLELAERPRPRAAALLAVAFGASLLGGHPQATLYLGYAWATLFAAWLLAAAPDRRQWLASSALAGAGLATGALLAAVQLLPTHELTRLGTRPAAAVDPAQLQPMGGFTVAVKQLLVHPISGSWLSFGAVALSLAAAALAGPRHRALAIWALAVGLLSGLAALGPLTPVFALYAHLPMASWFRIPERLTLLTDFAVAILVAIGVDQVTRARPRGVATKPLVLAAAALPAAAALLLAWQQGGRGVALVGLGGALALALALRPHAERPALASLALLALLLAEIAGAPRMPVSFPFGPRRLARVATYDAQFPAVREAAGHQRVWITGVPFEPALASKQATRHHLRTVDDYAPLALRRQGEYFTFLARGASTTTDPLGAFTGALRIDDVPGVPPPASRRRLLDLAAVRYLVSDDGGLALQPAIAQFLRAAGWAPPADLAVQPLRVFLNPDALPRAFAVYRTLPAPAVDDLLARLADPAFDPLVASFVEGDPGFVTDANAPAHGRAATFVRDDERTVELDATLDAPGLVVLADTYFPGWQATVDDRPAPIVATNHLFRGVPVPAGRHRVRFDYRPLRIWWGAAVSLAGVAILLALLTRPAAAGSRRRRT